MKFCGRWRRSFSTSRSIMLVVSLMAVYLVVPLAFSCTDSHLELLPPPPAPIPDNKIEVTGTLCTQNPEELVFPVRVVFLVDCSESMNVTDPPDPETGETGRERAVREAAEELLGSGGDVKISVVRFSSEAQPLTTQLENDPPSYFTDNLEQVLANIPKLGETDRTTNYIQALSRAYADMRNELINAEQESLALSSYQVVMVSDGIPDVDSGDAMTNSTDNVLESVEAIMELGRLFHINRIGVNTALLSSGNVMVDEAAEELLSAMAENGEGTFRSFASGGELNFLDMDLTAIKRMFTLKTLTAQNINASPHLAEVLSDSDGDGVDDITEIFSGSDPMRADSDGDGCRDGVEYHFRRSGMDPMDPDDCDCYVPDYCFDENEDQICDNGCTDADADGLCDCIDEDADGLCDDANYEDNDGDGLYSCEEIYTGTNRNGPDSDGDGLVDFLEFRFGTHPDDADSEEDLDWDVVTNGEEVRTATDPLNKVNAGRGKQAYRYNVKEIDGTDKQTCYSFSISNITVAELLPGNRAMYTDGPAGQGYSGYNRVLFFAGEVPFDDPQSYARFRVACVEAYFLADGNIKNPPSGVVELKPNNFVLLSKFDPDAHCVTPRGAK